MVHSNRHISLTWESDLKLSGRSSTTPVSIVLFFITKTLICLARQSPSIKLVIKNSRLELCPQKLHIYIFWFFIFIFIFKKHLKIKNKISTELWRKNILETYRDCKTRLLPFLSSLATCSVLSPFNLFAFLRPPSSSLAN